MSQDQGGELLFYGLVLILPVAALIARRQPLGRLLVSFAAWGGIFAVLLLVLNQRAAFDPYLDRIAAAFHLDDQQVIGRETRITMAGDGHFWGRVTIDGVSRRMLIDSGATVTALSTATASAAGLDASAGSVPVVIRTANGSVAADTAHVGELRLGDIVARDLAVVVSPAFGDVDVLGMNFLSRLQSWRVEGRTLILTPHHHQEFT